MDLDKLFERFEKEILPFKTGEDSNFLEEVKWLLKEARLEPEGMDVKDAEYYGRIRSLLGRAWDAFIGTPIRDRMSEVCLAMAAVESVLQRGEVAVPTLLRCAFVYAGDDVDQVLADALDMFDMPDVHAAAYLGLLDPLSGVLGSRPMLKALEVATAGDLRERIAEARQILEQGGIPEVIANLITHRVQKIEDEVRSYPTDRVLEIGPGNRIVLENNGDIELVEIPHHMDVGDEVGVAFFVYSSPVGICNLSSGEHFAEYCPVDWE